MSDTCLSIFGVPFEGDDLIHGVPGVPFKVLDSQHDLIGIPEWRFQAED